MTGRRASKADVPLLKEWFEKEASDTKIASKTGLHRMTVAAWRKELGFYRPRKGGAA